MLNDAEDPEAGSRKELRFAEMLRSSILLGGSAVGNLGIQLIRTKIFAVLLGPELFGVMGLYNALIQIIQSVVSLGLGQSAIREIAEAAGADDAHRTSRTIRAYRRLVFVTGLGGMALTAALSVPASLLTFGDRSHALAIAALSCVIFLSEIQQAQTALLSGLRRIRDLSVMNISGALLSTGLAVPIVLLLREHSVVPYIIAVAVGQLVASWWMSRKVRLAPEEVTWKDTAQLGRRLIRLGLTVVLTTLAAASSAYFSRMIVGHSISEAAVGVYQAAFTLSGVYVGFIIQVMGGDYYPRLAAFNDDMPRRNELINQQIIFAMLLATPGVMGTIVFGNLLITILYSAEFLPAAEILRWQILGTFVKIASWPLAFVLLARQDSRSLIFAECSTAVVQILAIWAGVALFGLGGSGAAYLVSNGCYMAALLFLTTRRHDYVPIKPVVNAVLLGGGLCVVAFTTTFIPSPLLRYAAGIGLTGLAGLYCLVRLGEEMPESRLGKIVHRVTSPLLKALRYAPRR